MLTQSEKNLIKLIVSGCNNQKDESIKLDDNDIKYMIKFASFHSLENIIYMGLKINSFNIPDDFKETIKTLFYKAVTQDCELQDICKNLNKNKIYHLPLKGSVMRKYYPTIEMRSMADLDILVDVNELKNVGNIVKELGYVPEHLGGNHDSYFKKPYMNIEIHRAMIDESYHMHDYYKDIWDKVIKDETYTCVLSDEDFYVFNIIHAGKHFSHGGTGLRIFCDLHFFLSSHPNLDFDYIYKELAQTSFDTFGKVLKDISDKMFGNEELGSELAIVLDYIIQCGTYGTINNSNIVGVIKEDNEDISKSKKSYFLERVFPPYKIMARRNPIIKKIPILLPFFWITRGFKGLFKIKNYKGEINNIKNINEEDLNRIKNIQMITKIRS